MATKYIGGNCSSSFFCINRYRAIRKTKEVEQIEAKCKIYRSLTEGCLRERIVEEHERATKIDDKTSRFTLSLSIALSVLTAASGITSSFLTDTEESHLVRLIVTISVLYMLLAGVTALGALKTLPTFGYGTHHQIKVKAEGVAYLSRALYCQEKMNIVRQLRNEAAYQSLRNGFVTLIIAILIFISS